MKASSLSRLAKMEARAGNVDLSRLSDEALDDRITAATAELEGAHGSLEAMAALWAGEGDARGAGLVRWWISEGSAAA